jgi:hypothetical protein
MEPAPRGGSGGRDRRASPIPERRDRALPSARGGRQAVSAETRSTDGSPVEASLCRGDGRLDRGLVGRC